MYYVGTMSKTSCCASRISLLLLYVEYSFFLFLIMCPFSVAVDSGRCLLVRSHVNPGSVLNTLGWFLVAFKDVELGGDPITW